MNIVALLAIVLHEHTILQHITVKRNDIVVEMLGTQTIF
jgi:hypothetical protein